MIVVMIYAAVVFVDMFLLVSSGIFFGIVIAVVISSVAQGDRLNRYYGNSFTSTEFFFQIELK
jgi:hypothetical protein